MKRHEFLRELHKVTANRNYLEIGVCTGESFIPLKARRKWGVDPDHYLSWKRIAKYELFRRLGLKDERVFRQTSDEFFERHFPLAHFRISFTTAKSLKGVRVVPMI